MLLLLLWAYDDARRRHFGEKINTNTKNNQKPIISL